MSEIIYLKDWLKKQGKTTTSASQSKLNITWDILGAIPTKSQDLANNEIEHIVAFHIVLDKAARTTFKLKSNFAREAALYVATCASLGFITNQIELEEFSSEWNITPMGLDLLGELNEIIENIAGEDDPDITH
jgi:hypothetical protein